MSAGSPGVLVGADWVAEHLRDPDLLVLEVDEQPLAYRLGHMPGAHLIDWRTDLRDPVTRDLPTPERMTKLWARLGITARTTVVFYGDKNNWYACLGYWLFRFYGLKRLALLDGGRPLWVTSGFPLTTDPPSGSRGGRTPRPKPAWDMRAGWWDVLHAARVGDALVDVRTPAEYRGDAFSEAGYPDEAAQRAGHIPTAVSVPWDVATDTDGRFLPAGRLREIYTEAGAASDTPTITYCRIGERSAHTWFVLHELLGHPNVRNYDGSWAEWGSMVAMPIALGGEPGRWESTTDPCGPGGRLAALGLTAE